MARANRQEKDFDHPPALRIRRGGRESQDRFGRFTESFARGMGTPAFLFGLLIFVIVWMLYTTFAPADWWTPDNAALGFTVLTLILSVQASVGSPLILLAQNRQD